MQAATRKLQFSRIAGPLFFVCALVYLGFHSLNGERGVYALFKESRKLEALKQELAEVTDERQRLERKVRLLNSSSLDLDLLDEQARAVLGYMAPDEVVLLQSDQKSPK